MTERSYHQHLRVSFRMFARACANDQSGWSTFILYLRESLARRLPPTEPLLQFPSHLGAVAFGVEERVTAPVHLKFALQVDRPWL